MGDKDPWVTSTFNVFQSWVDILSDTNLPVSSVCAAWDKAILRMQVPPKRRWRKVIGPTTAILATLFDLDWRLLGPTEWIAPCGDHFRSQVRDFRGQLPDLHDLRTALAKSVHMNMWSRAALNSWQGKRYREDSRSTRLQMLPRETTTTR